MLGGWTILAVALGYLGLLFAIAFYGDKLTVRHGHGNARPVVYALSLAVYCTSWTYFGSVGLAARSGLDFLPIYIGPIIMLAAGWPLLRRIAVLAKRQNITSIADFIAARYGKSQGLGALVAAIAVIGVLPYISLQLKAVSNSLETLLERSQSLPQAAFDVPVLNDLALMVAFTMAVFTVLFGTRHIDATEHQDGLIMAIAAESVVKLIAFLIVGAYVTFVMFGAGELIERASARPDIVELFTKGFDGGRWLTMTLLSMIAIMLLPRQFHVAVVENTDTSDIRKAAWLFPLYLVAINLFVVPIAIAGLLTFAPGTTDADMFVLALPMSSGQHLATMVAFIGGLSAATAMVIVATIALSIMVCNDIVVPLVVRRREMTADPREDMGRLLINIRRGAIFVILALAYGYYRMVSDSVALASIGLLSFAAIAQFAPAFFGGLIWRRATKRGAVAGIVAGFSMWVYTLLLPSFIASGWLPAGILADGPFGLGLLRPQVLFNLEFDPLTHGVLWSLACNIGAYIAFSLLSQPQPIERLQANIFVTAELPAAAPNFRLWRTQLLVGDLKSTVARYLGETRTERAFAEFAQSRNLELEADAEADIRLMRYAEHLLASAVGAASSRLIMALLIERRSPNRRGAMKLLDDASDAIQYNRDLLQSAIDHVRQGIGVFDKDLELICWNRQFRGLLDLPAEMGRIGVPLEEILRTVAANAGLTDADAEWNVSDRINRLIVTREPYQERLRNDETVLEVRSDFLPDGGMVVTFADITQRVKAAEALLSANETLERRVEERTAALTALNKELTAAKAKAEEADLGKTRFLAAASHDILQPLNAARLFTTSLVERRSGEEDSRLIQNVDASLEAVEDILVTLLEISRLDGGALKPELSNFRIDDVLGALEREFEPMAREKNLEFKVMSSSVTVRSDRRLLRRVLQNFVSNAIKYTDRGRVLMGCRRVGDRLRVEVHDTGPGIPQSKQKQIFKEFERLGDGKAREPGLGLGLSIVERIGHVLNHPIDVRSTPRKGSSFSIALPVSEPVAALPATPSRSRLSAMNLDGMTVLCIDNEPAILEGMRTILEGWKCTVLAASDRQEARDALAAAPDGADMIIADYHLDSGDGLSVIQALREHIGYAVPALLITADRDRLLQERARQAGVAFMNKPVRPAALRATVSRARTETQAAE